MSRRLRNQRMWELFEQFPRAALYRIGRAASAPVRGSSRKHELLDLICALPDATLERALVEGLTLQDLQGLCERIGRARRGSKGDLAARILAAVDEPAPRSPRWRPFAEARAFVHSLELGNQKEWFAFARGRLPARGALPDDIPRHPHRTYAKTGWTSWGDWLGTGFQSLQRRTYRPFRQARAYARSLGLTNREEWQALCRARSDGRPVLPPDIPATPHRIYAGRGWVGYGDWLGTGRIHASPHQHRSYEEACAFVRSLGIRSQIQWWAYCRGEIDGLAPRPRDIPGAPDQVYRGKGWVSWGHFFGTNAVATYNRTYRSFAAARAYVRKQGLHSRHAWRDWCAAGHRPDDIPAAPNRTYRDRGWVSWGDFLGTDNVHPTKTPRRSFAAARAHVRRLGLRSGGEYLRAWREGRIPKDIPAMIHQHPEWKGWADFLGPSYTGSSNIRATPAKTRRRKR